MNVPYKKNYDENGVLINPIVEKLENFFPNRSERRKVKQKARFFGNGKNVSLTVTKTSRYLRRIQLIGSKRVEHYVLIKN